VLTTIFLAGLNIGLAQVTFNTTYHNAVDLDFNILPESNAYYKVMTAYSGPDAKYVFQKLDSAGNILISKPYGNVYENFLTYNLIKSYDNNFIAGCYFNDLTTNRYQPFIAKFDHAGDTIWTKKITACTACDIYSDYLIETMDHGFLITGEIADTNLADGNIFILKTDSIGNFQWINSFGGTKFDAGYASAQTSDGGFLTIGWTRSFGFGNNSNRDDIVVKWDSVGNYQWHKTYGTILNETAISIQKLQDGNYIIGSGRNDLIQNIPNGKLLKIDENGNVIYQKFYGTGIDSYWNLQELLSQELIACGSIKVNGLHDGFLIKTDSSGNELWRRQYRFGNSHCYFREVKATFDGGYICAGFVQNGASGGQDGWIVKLDSTGCLANSCGEPTGLLETNKSSPYAISVYPNPITDNAIVKIEGLPQTLLASRFNLLLLDITGKKIEISQPGFLITENGIQCIFNKGSIHNGIYLLEATTSLNESLGVVKVIVQ
jgi:hypothetical protein